MTKRKQGLTGQNLLLWVVGGSITTLVALILFWTVYLLQDWQSEAATVFNTLLSEWASKPTPPELATDLASVAYAMGNKMLIVFSSAIGVLFATIILLLLILGYQLYLRSQDLKKLDLWRESGFLCERLEFLPANRVKLNNLELELNKTQIDNLQKLAHHRVLGKPLHSLDMGDHAVQSIKRLREELGSKFIEKSLVKVRRSEGYWLEVEASKIYGLSDPII